MEDAPDYAGLDRVAEDDIFEDPLSGNPQTLMQLQHGINGAAAGQLIEDSVYKWATVSNFLAVRLNRTTGSKHPALFDTATCEL